MNLPHFGRQYIQLVHIPLDVMHECLKLQLGIQLPDKPSPLSVKQVKHTDTHTHLHCTCILYSTLYMYMYMYIHVLYMYVHVHIHVHVLYLGGWVAFLHVCIYKASVLLFPYCTHTHTHTHTH